jgi:hypothetical protein
MTEPHLLPRQPHTAISFWNVGSLLYGSVVLFILETLFYWSKLQNAYLEGTYFFIVFWSSCVLFAFSHIFLVIMDGWSRFQTYKKVKDALYMNGFTPKIAGLYQGSRCQRTAVIVAAKELGMQHEAERYYRRLGIKWFHFVPDFMVTDPLFIFKRYFWSRTFLEKYYEPKFNYRAMNQNLDYDAYRK